MDEEYTEEDRFEAGMICAIAAAECSGYYMPVVVECVLAGTPAEALALAAWGSLSTARHVSGPEMDALAADMIWSGWSPGDPVPEPAPEVRR